jgi:hypothetical protein
MKIPFNVVAAAVIVTLLSGCASGPTKLVNPPSSTIDSQFVTGTLIAMCDDPSTCNSFELTLNNKTEVTLEIDWNRSYYINNGRADGGLYFDGIVVAQRNNPRSPDIILPKSSFQKKLVPNKHLELALFPLAHWKVKEFEGDSHGVYVTLKSGAKEETLNVSVSLTKSRQQ